MAIYGDGKHNENMEYNTPKYEITDKVSYMTVHFTVESEDGKEYRVSMAENDFYDDYKIMDEQDNEIEPGTDLYEELVMLCDVELKK
jgi:hypothetical protein